MEHIVQFGINIDDKAIANTIVKQATNQLENDLKQDIADELCKARYNSYEYKNKLMEIVRDITLEFFEEHKKEIIKQASDKLAEKLVKTKAVKQAVEDVMAKL